MDFFEAYPDLAESPVGSLTDRELRLIALSAFVYDEDAFYFEFGQRRFWGQSSEGQTLIGVGAPRVQPVAGAPPYQGLVRYLEKVWRCEVALFPTNHTYLLDEDDQLAVLENQGPYLPYMLIMTSPRLGGANVPDALVRAVYLMPVQRLRTLMASVELLRVERDAFPEFIKSEQWALEDLRSRTWAEIVTDASLPADAQIRPVMALRSIRSLTLSGDLPGILGS